MIVREKAREGESASERARERASEGEREKVDRTKARRKIGGGGDLKLNMDLRYGSAV